MPLFVTLIAVLLQLAAAVYALRLIRVTGYALGWSLICAALVLMIIRRIFVFYHGLVAGTGAPPDLTSETVSLVISLFMLAGILAVEPMFRAMRQTRDMVQRQSEQLAAVNRELETFAYTLTHDLKSPLRRILGYLDLFRQDCPEISSDTNNWLGHVETNAREMERLIESILQYSRSGFAEVNPQQVDLSAMAQAILMELKGAEPGRVASLDVQPGISVVTDPALLRIVLHNLLGNAWKFTRGKAETVIHVRSWVDEGNSVVQIADNGIGFEGQDTDQMFKPFQRLHQDSSFSGFGIGLATVKRIIDRHGGHISAEGRPGEGATFTFSFGESGTGKPR